MATAQPTFDQVLKEKLIPWINKPIGVHAMTALASEYDAEQKSLLRTELLAGWEIESEAMDHRKVCRNTVKVSFGRLTHYISARAMGEFARLKKLYDGCYTAGLKETIDNFVLSDAGGATSVAEDCEINGWRVDHAKVKDFRRRNGERLMLVTAVGTKVDGESYRGKTANISNGGALVCFAKGKEPDVAIDSPMAVTYEALCKQYKVEVTPVRYQVVNVDKSTDIVRIALKRVDKDNKAEFDQLIAHLMNEHKRRNKLDVNNTVNALTARCFNMAAIAQQSSLMVLSHRQERYHLLISQGQSLHLQAELQIHGDMIPDMVERTGVGQSKLFFVWANSRQQVNLVALDEIPKDQDFRTIIAHWQNAIWSKAFLLKADSLDPQLADLGTSLPCDVAPIVSKLNAPLPVKVARLSQELAKMTIIEDITYFVEPTMAQMKVNGAGKEKLKGCQLRSCKGQLRQVPFDKNALEDFQGTYRFGHGCRLRTKDVDLMIVNGYSDNKRSVLSLPLSKHDIAVGDTVTIVWTIDEMEISLPANIVDYDILNHSTTVEWEGEQAMVDGVFRELEILCVFNQAFTADLQAEKLDSALRNLILSNLPKVSIFAKVREQAISMTGMTGLQYLDGKFVDDSQKAKLDLLFSPEILRKLAIGGNRQREVLMVSTSVAEDGELMSERFLFSDTEEFQYIKQTYEQLAMQSEEIFVFAMDASAPRGNCEDAIINIEYKYVTHYSPAKAKKLDQNLTFDLCIQMVDISDVFRAMMST